MKIILATVAGVEHCHHVRSGCWKIQPAKKLREKFPARAAVTTQPRHRVPDEPGKKKMKVNGNFIVLLSDRQEGLYNPQGHWAVTVGMRVLMADAVNSAAALWEAAELTFRSHSGATGGTLRGSLIAPGVFEGRGEVWGAGHSDWQAGSLFAPSISTVRLYAVSPQTYTGSLPGLHGQAVQAAKAAYEAIPCGGWGRTPGMITIPEE